MPPVKEAAYALAVWAAAPSNGAFQGQQTRVSHPSSKSTTSRAFGLSAAQALALTKHGPSTLLPTFTGLNADASTTNIQVQGWRFQPTTDKVLPNRIGFRSIAVTFGPF